MKKDKFPEEGYAPYSKELRDLLLELGYIDLYPAHKDYREGNTIAWYAALGNAARGVGKRFQPLREKKPDRIWPNTLEGKDLRSYSKNSIMEPHIFN